MTGEGREGHTALRRAEEPWQLGGEGTGGQGRLLLQGRHLQLVWPGAAWREGMAWQTRERSTARGPEPLPHANMVSCNHCRQRRAEREVSQGQQKRPVQPPSPGATVSGEGHFLTSSTPGRPGRRHPRRPPGACPPPPFPRPRHPHPIPSFHPSRGLPFGSGSEATSSCPRRVESITTRIPSPATAKGSSHLKQIKGHHPVQICVQSFEKPYVQKKTFWH